MLHRFNFIENSGYFNSLLIPLLLGLCFFSPVPNISGQELPNKIRGYKVHKTKISVTNESAITQTVKENKTFEEKKKKKELGVEVEFEEPELTNLSLLGITLELETKVIIFGQSGTVDFISFRDFKVNGLNVEIEEYRKSFDFKKGDSIQLEKPVEIFVSTGQTLRGALKEFKNSKDEWLITGRVFVFGRFNKFGFKFKRVIPVEVNLMIRNPLKKESSN